jgi:hypothetical protein
MPTASASRPIERPSRPSTVASCAAASRVARDATSVTHADVDRLRTLGLTDSEILDVVLAAAARCFFSKTLDALGAEPDAKYSELQPDLRDTLTVGRPGDDREWWIDRRRAAAHAAVERRVRWALDCLSGLRGNPSRSGLRRGTAL